MKFFKPEDFNQVNSLWSREDLASHVNAKLEREGKRVYCCDNQPDSLWDQTLETIDTHQALLINIEPIEKCTHPKERVTFIKQFLTHGLYLGKRETNCIGEGWMCECGARVEPAGFKAVEK